MAEDHIRYDILTQDALRGVVRKVLTEIEKTGLPGEHHFFISFMTRAPGVRISERLLERYPNEMTIVLQNQYWDLTIGETGFSVGLAFDGINETLGVPYSAMKGFFDPSVQFGLQFDVSGLDEEGEETEEASVTELNQDDDPSPRAVTKDSTDSDEEPEEGKEKVVSLDAFRKKP